MDKLAAECQ